MNTEDIKHPFQSYASEKGCECNLCCRVQSNPTPEEEIEYCNDIPLPN